MKHLLFTSICILVLSNVLSAQPAETFDIATFQPPTGWKRQNKPGAVVFSTSNEQKGTYAMITLYPSGQSSGNAKSDFEGDWAEFVAGQLGAKTRPEIEPAKKVDGWEVVTGGAAFDETGQAAVILSTYSGFGKTFSAAAVFNSQDNLPAIEAFAASIKLKKTAVASQPVPANNDNASILGTWGIDMVVQYTAATSYNGTAGSTSKQYTFRADGTYSFVIKTFKFSYEKLLLTKENGTYRISGVNITISPEKSVIQAWSKKEGTGDWGRLLSTQNRALEKVTYRFTKHYFSGIQTWSLVFQSDKPTERDGPFSGGTGFDNSWIYQPPCDQCLIKLPN